MEPITKIISNAHTHTDLCDGKATAEAMVLAAIDAGFTTLGFSGHSYLHFDDSYAMSPEGLEQYRAAIAALKEKYRGCIDIVYGLEWDWFSEGVDPSRYDYTIGSVHHFFDQRTGKYYSVDYTIENLQECKDEMFGGDGLAMAANYYDNVIRMVRERKPDIAGHLDLIRKLNAGNRFFDETSPAYLELAKAAAKACVDEGCVIEVNTGGVFRRYRNTPYPAEPVLRYIAELGGKVMINSDSHSTDSLDFMFPQALELLKRCGFTQVYQLTAKGLEASPLQICYSHMSI